MLDTISPPESHSTPNPVKENSAFNSSPTDVPLGGEAETILTPLPRTNLFSSVMADNQPASEAVIVQGIKQELEAAEDTLNNLPGGPGRALFLEARSHELARKIHERLPPNPTNALWFNCLD